MRRIEEMKKHRLPQGYAACSLLSVLVFCRFAPGSDDARQWLRQAASATVPAYEKEVTAVVLLKEQRITIDDEGRQKSLKRGALKILKQPGRNLAMTRTFYRTDGEKVRDMSAWLILPSGKVRKYGKKAVLDMAAATDGTST